MKKITLLSLVVLSAAVIGASEANATPMPTQKETPTTIKFTEDQDNPDKPTDPEATEDNLSLTSVPTGYSFTSKMISTGQYDLTSTLNSDANDNGNKIIVFNQYKNQEWAVRASVVNNKLEDSNNANVIYDVTEFNVKALSGTVVNILETGSNVVAKSAATKTLENNQGYVKTQIESVGIKFNDPNKTLKNNSELKGSINYTLYSTDAAK